MFPASPCWRSSPLFADDEISWGPFPGPLAYFACVIFFCFFLKAGKRALTSFPVRKCLWSCLSSCNDGESVRWFRSWMLGLVLVSGCVADCLYSWRDLLRTWPRNPFARSSWQLQSGILRTRCHVFFSLKTEGFVSPSDTQGSDFPHLLNEGNTAHFTGQAKFCWS